MNLIIKILALALAALLLAGCGEQAPAETLSKETVYSVTVADALGTPYTTGVIVCFLQNGQQVAMQPVNGDGVASKTLNRGDYTVELVFTGEEGQYHYEKEGLTLSAEKTELTVELSMTVLGEGRPLYAPEGETLAYGVGDGSNYLPLTAGKRNYFLYTPTTPGTYEFAVKGEGATIGYYGAPHFVQRETAAEVADNAFSLSIRADMIGADNTGTTVIVIGVDANSVDNTVLTIQRTGDPEWSVADEPWHIYEPTAALAAYTLPAGVQLKNFDIKAATDAYTLAYNEADGFYHLGAADGPLVLVWLGEDTEYLACFEAILDRSGVNKYFYDENGTFLRKESYSECLLQYLEVMDPDAGVYPLTEDLKYIIQQRGEFSGWFDPQGQSYLFVDENGNLLPGINNEISWLFMCCYMEG